MSHLAFIQRMHAALEEADLVPHSWEIRSYPTLASTNTRVADMLGLYPKAIVLSLSQSQGRGRGNNVWYSPTGGLWLSLGFTTNIDVEELSGPVVRAVDSVIGRLVDTEVKEPNDILIGGKKVCGVLVETKISRQKLREVVVGIGVNVENELPDEVEAIATRLADHCDPPELQKLGTEVAIAVILAIGDYIPNSSEIA